ncbi:ester cyclase [Lentzea nigeriaca]|uniref:ester cyclase n=1 Tax=Lentzea nigeriaca TaxID=1128665 RepID=UPI00195942BE|nr:ester cyclase [Lentzea nigeriaca]MBM7859902.1 putative SnoaL-like aldol condensation-catalyzing enzyme [Lentzea nigeriaca]
MTPADNRAVVRRFLDEVVAEGRFELLTELCAPDVVNHAAAPERRHGVENIKAVLGFSLGAQPDQRWVERHFIADGDLVVVYGRRVGTWQAPGFRGVPTPESGEVSVELAHMFRLRDAKIVEHWAVRDDLGMLQQLGAISAGS